MMTSKQSPQEKKKKNSGLIPVSYVSRSGCGEVECVEGYGRESGKTLGLTAVSSAALRIFLVPVLPIPKLEDHRFSPVWSC
jgi:hypothetical protein